jgi:hypothetical protein
MGSPDDPILAPEPTVIARLTLEIHTDECREDEHVREQHIVSILMGPDTARTFSEQLRTMADKAQAVT